MEIIKLINDTWQLIDEQGSVLIQGTWDECSDRLCEIENNQYRDFLMMSGIWNLQFEWAGFRSANQKRPDHYARVVELVVTPDLGSGAERCESSSLSLCTKTFKRKRL